MQATCEWLFIIYAEVEEISKFDFFQNRKVSLIFSMIEIEECIIIFLYNKNIFMYMYYMLLIIYQSFVSYKIDDFNQSSEEKGIYFYSYK
jgi:hypothetical protein